MDPQFTHEGEYYHRGKGSKKTRLAPRIASTGIRRPAERLTPDDIALKALSKIANNLKVNFGQYQEKLRYAEQLRFMNMNILAHVLLYMDRNMGMTEENEAQIDINPMSINEAIHPIITKEMRDSSTDRDIAEKRLAFTFLRYIKFVLMLREPEVEYAVIGELPEQ
jgi:hypothetical protein